MPTIQTHQRPRERAVLTDPDPKPFSLSSESLLKPEMWLFQQDNAQRLPTCSAHRSLKSHDVTGDATSWPRHPHQL